MANTSTNSAQLKTTLVHRAMSIIHTELEDTLNTETVARRWRSTNIIMRRQLSARARDIVEQQWNPIGVPGTPEYLRRFQDLVGLYKLVLQDHIIARMNSGQSPHTSDESSQGSDGSDDSESDEGEGQGYTGYTAPKIANTAFFHSQPRGEFY
ncbi:hypothetical protein NLJ89_g3853 [Agrocybe chaxingu]|uniref:Uncharacterized protein n=1 Tax=Agrocybe chaxingu TaxID=84603 RepID=A0A9W8MWH5_9AGAR|nr:hypothetical protein NLJ89_g3853 [Agrocybe chaxingu]